MEAGVGVVVGAVTTTSLSTETTISTATRVSVAATAPTSVRAPRIQSRAAATVATLAAATVRQLYRLAAAIEAGMLETPGSTIRNIAVVLRIATGQLRTGSGARRAVILLPIARPAPGNSLADRAAIWLAIAAEELASAIELEVGALATGRGVVGRIASGAGISPAAAAETGMLSEEEPGDTTGLTLAPAAAAAPPACHLEAEAEVSVAAEEASVAVVAGGAGERDSWRKRQLFRSMDMKFTSATGNLPGNFWIVGAVGYACLCASLISVAQQSVAKAAPAATVAPAIAGARTFDSPQQAADELVDAAEKFDVVALGQIFGPGGQDIVLSGEYAQDRQHASNFASEAREKKVVSVDPKGGNRAFLLVGNEDWPFPVPLVKWGGKWFFDAKAGRQELLYRRIGANELDAIQICHGYVEAQNEYAFQPREGYKVNQYAQRIISTPGNQDGLAWQNPDGTWGGPIGEKIARAIEQGYTGGSEPYHGYFFKILKAQGPAAPLGEMDFVVKGVMIGGFALVAAPAEYGVTGVRTFIVSHDGVVYENDFGSETLNVFKKMERFNPDKSWTPVPEEDE